MRIYKPTYRGRDGQTHDAEKFYAELRTADGRVLRLPGFVSERQTTKLGDNVQKLIDCVAKGPLKNNIYISAWDVILVTW
ncbi:MAG: hypothetical protein ACP5VQ_04125, partial [Phycisphaerae bacterium]